MAKAPYTRNLAGAQQLECGLKFFCFLRSFFQISVILSSLGFVEQLSVFFKGSLRPLLETLRAHSSSSVGLLFFVQGIAPPTRNPAGAQQLECGLKFCFVSLRSLFQIYVILSSLGFWIR